jgi:hypothetical protein
MGAFRIPVRLSDLLQTAASTRLADDGICRQSLLNAALFLRRDPALAPQLSSEVGQLLIGRNNRHLYRRKRLHFSCQNMSRHCVRLNASRMCCWKCLDCWRTVGRVRSELAILRAFARFFAVVCDSVPCPLRRINNL